MQRMASHGRSVGKSLRRPRKEPFVEKRAAISEYKYEKKNVSVPGIFKWNLQVSRLAQFMSSRSWLTFEYPHEGPCVVKAPGERKKLGLPSKMVKENIVPS